MTGLVISDSSITWQRDERPTQPDWLLGATAFPIMFVLLFAYVFGDAIGGPGGGGGEYREFLIAGIRQTVAFSSSYGHRVRQRPPERIIDRFRSPPMSRLAVLSAARPPIRCSASSCWW